MPRNPFSRDEDLLILAHTINGWSPPRIGREMYRHTKSIYFRLRTLGVRNKKDAVFLLNKLTAKAPSIIPDLSPLQEEQQLLLDAYDRRDLTASFCGDPAPGYSMLDKQPPATAKRGWRVAPVTLATSVSQ